MNFSQKAICTLLPIGIILSDCEVINEKVKTTLPKEADVEKQITEQKTVFIKCGVGDIDNYLKDGWEIVSSQTKEVTCTWKTKRARRGCNLKLDKGCRIRIPDKVGEETQYSLEKKRSFPEK